MDISWFPPRAVPGNRPLQFTRMEAGLQHSLKESIALQFVIKSPTMTKSIPVREVKKKNDDVFSVFGVERRLNDLNYSSIFLDMNRKIDSTP